MLFIHSDVFSAAPLCQLRLFYHKYKYTASFSAGALKAF